MNIKKLYSVVSLSDASSISEDGVAIVENVVGSDLLSFFLSAGVHQAIPQDHLDFGFVMVYREAGELYYQSTTNPYAYEFMDGAEDFGDDVEGFKRYILSGSISDATAYASARVFTNSTEANTFLGQNPQYKVVPNQEGTPATSVTVALDNDEGFVSDSKKKFTLGELQALLRPLAEAKEMGEYDSVYLDGLVTEYLLKGMEGVDKDGFVAYYDEYPEDILVSEVDFDSFVLRVLGRLNNKHGHPSNYQGGLTEEARKESNRSNSLYSKGF